MNMLDILKNLYTNRNSDWIMTIEDNHIQPFVIQRWLCMNDRLRKQTRWLDKYVFTLQAKPKMYLSLAWSIIPKASKMPFIPYIKQKESDDEYDFILSKVRRHFKLSDNDFNAMKIRLINYIKADMVKWFSFYGVQKKYWKKYYVDFKLIKNFGTRDYVKPQKGLSKWG